MHLWVLSTMQIIPIYIIQMVYTLQLDILRVYNIADICVNYRNTNTSVPVKQT